MVDCNVWRWTPIIKEEKSAKKANNRPLFLEMLSEFPKRYDGLLAYHPDRIARNMRDAGVIIDLLNPDNALIKNMAFPTVQYANDSSGRLTLAVLFSLATQFSEHLSEMVKRGVDTNLGKHSPAYGTNEQDLLDLQNEIIDLDTEVNKITAKLTNVSKIKLTKDEF